MASSRSILTRQRWNGLSDVYEQYFEETAINVFHAMLPLCKLSSATRVVEAACGTGKSLQILRTILPETVEIFASDLSDAMVSKASQRNLPNVFVVQSDFSRQPYENEFCDRFIINGALHLAENPEDVIREAFRVLKQEGIAAFSVLNNSHPTNYMNFVMSHCENFGNKVQENSIFRLGEEGLLRNLMIENGFERVLEVNTSVCFGITTTDEFIEISKIMPSVKRIQNEHSEEYEQLLTNLRTESQKVLDSGKAFVFESLIVVGYKKNI